MLVYCVLCMGISGLMRTANMAQLARSFHLSNATVQYRAHCAYRGRVFGHQRNIEDFLGFHIGQTGPDKTLWP